MNHNSLAAQVYEDGRTYRQKLSLKSIASQSELISGLSFTLCLCIWLLWSARRKQQCYHKSFSLFPGGSDYWIDYALPS